MKKLLISMVVLLIVVLFVGCTTFNAVLNTLQHQREVYVEAHPELSEQKKQDILAGRIRTGFSKEEVVASRGEPGFKRKSYYGDGVRREQWGYYGKYYYFENGVLVGWN